jgi:hypothetical protein
MFALAAELQCPWDVSRSGARSIRRSREGLAIEGSVTLTGSQMDPATRSKHSETRLKRWISSVGTVTLPLLAGFSITAVVVVSEDSTKFRWPGTTILVLAFAALVLIAAVQCAYHAHVYLSKQDPNYNEGVTWAKRTRWFYDAGLLTLIAGLALIVAPNGATGTDADLRWAAACLAFLGEGIWLVVDPWLRSGDLRETSRWCRLGRPRCICNRAALEEFHYSGTASELLCMPQRERVALTA